MSVPEAAKLLGIGRNTAYEAAKRGELPVIRIGRRILICVPALLRMIETAQGKTSVPSKEPKAEPIIQGLGKLKRKAQRRKQ
jgi:excisionase family DNA binding protein